jgi:16S rRNA G1207 methylase RsmC
LAQIANGENRNLKKEFQFFATPDPLADTLVELAELNDTAEILEPSAGQGAIVKAIHKSTWQARTVWGYEAMDVNQKFLEKIPGFRLLGDDFLTCDTSFDRIIANPPFSKNQDIVHIRKMYDQLSHGGRLVSIASTHWQHSSNKKEVQFKEWLQTVGAKIKNVEKGAFKESGTNVAAVIIVIDK